MKYIKEDRNGLTSYDEYFKYIESIKDEIPLDLYLFASNIKRYTLDDKETLHDSWLETIKINDDLVCENNTNKLNVFLSLLGAYHDRKHRFSYFSVNSYKIINMAENKRAKQDLLFFEFRVENGYIIHELEFNNDFVIMVSCKSILYEEVILSK